LSCKKYLEHRAKYLRKNSTRKIHLQIPYFTKSQIALYEKVISNTIMRRYPNERKNPSENCFPEFPLYTADSHLDIVKPPTGCSHNKGLSNLFRKNANENATDINAFAILVGIFKEHSIELVANIIYANSKIVLLSRYIFYDKTKYNEKQIPKSLYLNKCKSSKNDTGLLITSEPLFNVCPIVLHPHKESHNNVRSESKYDSILFPENTVTILDYQKYDLDIYKL